MLAPSRYVKLEVSDNQGGIRLFENANSRGARIDFNVVRKTNSFKNGFNTALIKLYNITDNTYQFIRDSGHNVSFSVGNNGLPNKVINPIFLGYVFNTLQEKQGVDIVTTLYCSSVDTSTMNDLKKPISRSYKNSSLRAVLDDISKSINFSLGIGEFKELSNIQITNFSITGETISEILDYFASTYNFYYYVDNKTIYVVDFNSKNQPVTRISADTGLIKPPIRTEKGVDIETFLIPNINPTDYFVIESNFQTFNLGALQFQDRTASQNGAFMRKSNIDLYTATCQVIWLEHDGSTHSNTWVTKLDGVFR